MNTEFSHLVRAGHIHGQAQVFELSADAQACAALATRFGLPAIAALSGRFELYHERGGVIAGSLAMAARVTQLCVITLEPFETDITEQAVLRFIPAAALTEEEEVAADSLEGPDEIPYENDEIDLGEALAEQLALALDPYPRKPGAALPEEARDEDAHPFAGLKGRFGKLS